MLVGASAVLLLGVLPFRTKRGIRLSMFPAQWMAKAFLWIFNLRLHCPNPERLRNHSGMVVCNHLSFTDIILLLSVTPVRFMSTAGVRNLPVIGWMAVVLDTIFVKRSNQESRSQAREEAVEKLSAQKNPPVVIFPEGVIGEGDEVAPFRYGAFEIAAQSHVNVLPCAITYAPLSVIHFGRWEDTLPGIVWKLATQPGGVQATLVPTPVLDPQTYEEPAQIAEESHQAIAEIYQQRSKALPSS